MPMQRRSTPGVDIVVPPPIRVRDTEGRERLVGRRPALHFAGRLFCPNRHFVRDSLTGLEEHTVRCNSNLEGSTTPCGILLFIIAGFRTRSGAELTYAVEVTYDEIRRMRHMELDEKLHYLQLTWAKER